MRFFRTADQETGFIRTNRGRRAPWKRVLRELRREFSVLDRELSLLQEIDQSILRSGTRGEWSLLESVFLDAMDEFSKIHRSKIPLSCYVNLGSEFALLKRPGSEGAAPPTVRFIQTLDAFRAAREKLSAMLLSPNEDAVFSAFDGMRTILLYPLFSERAELICVFLVADAEPKRLSHLRSADFRNSVAALASQLEIAYNQHDGAVHHAGLERIWGCLLDSDLSPSESVKQIADLVRSLFPAFGPMRLAGERPGVQILMLTKDAESGTAARKLVIRGSTGDEPAGTKIHIGRSFTGLIVERRIPYLCGDPTLPKYKGRYKAYLGSSIRTELAVALVVKKELIGVLNFESTVPDAFNVHHINAMVRVAASVAPILAVLERRRELNADAQISVASSTARYLEALTKVYRHALRSPFATLKVNLDSASRAVQPSVEEKLTRAVELVAQTPQSAKLRSLLQPVRNGLKDAFVELEDVAAAHAEIVKYSLNFLRDIHSYGETGTIDLQTMVKETIRLAGESLLAHSRPTTKISVDYDRSGGEATVFGSPFLKQHLYSILHNAVLHIGERARTDHRNGAIAIRIAKEKPRAGQEIKLNTAWVVRIRDDGTGVTPRQLEELRRFNPGTTFRKNGSGSGLFAAQRFMASIGGRIELDSELGTFFEVSFHFQNDRRAVKPQRESSGAAFDGHAT